MRKQIIGMAFATLLWLVSTVLGGIAMLQAYEATRIIATFVIPIDPEWTVAHGPQVTVVTRLVLLILAITLLAVAILLLEKYFKAVAEPRRLVRMFSVTAAIELAIIGLANAIIYLLPGLALDVTP